MTELRAVLWDVDGTLAETERDGHRVAFNLAFEEFGFNWRWSEARYGELLNITGGRERLLFDMATQPEAPVNQDKRRTLAGRMHKCKNRFYAELVGQRILELRHGVLELMDECERSGITMAITTTTSAANLEALLKANLGALWRERFASVVVGENVSRKKPDPEVFVLALQELEIEPAATVALEDSPAGVAAATAAGVPVIVTRSRYFAEADMPGAIAIGPGLHTHEGWEPPAPVSGSRIRLADIRWWHANQA